MSDAWKNRIVGYDEVPPDALTLNPLNWRRHPDIQSEALLEVLERVGWAAGPVIVNRTTGHVVDGHLRVELARRRGVPTVPVQYVELTPEEELAVLATIDPIAALDEADDAVLGALLTELNEADADLAQLAAAVHDADAAVFASLGDGEAVDAPPADMDAAEVLREKWGVEHGDLWVIPSRAVPGGEHRIICGDSTDPQVVARVMQGEKAAAMWTDPPYGVEYKGGTKDALTIMNDSAEVLGSLLRGAFGAVDGVLTDGSAIYVAHPPGVLQLAFGEAILATGWRLHQTLVWVKDRMVLGHSDYHYQHEPVFYGWKGKNRRWYGGRDKVSVFRVERPARNAEHPTMKPPELVEAMLANSTKRGDVVIDPFLGSGTTLVACERLGRLGRGVEIEPKYVAVALERLAEMGLQPVRAEGGRGGGEV